MIAIDTNILIHAHREESPKHHQAKTALQQLINQGDIFIPVFCVGEFLRVITHPKLFAPAHTPAQATSSLSGLLAIHGVHVLKAQDTFPSILFALMVENEIKGNLVFDALIAAVLIESGIKSLLSEDRDFKRFREIKCISLQDLTL